MTDDLRQKNNLRIVGINLLILAIYTIISGMFKELGIYFDAIIIVIHMIICMIMALIKNNGIWILSGLVVLLIGFSTCAGILVKIH